MNNGDDEDIVKRKEESIKAEQCSGIDRWI